MARRSLTRLYACLLRLYPRPFTTEFGDEMHAVFAQALQNVDASRFPSARRRIEMVRLFLKEAWDFPTAFLTVQRLHANSSGEEVINYTVENGAREKPHAWTGQPASWGETLLGALPFLLFGLAYFLEALTELGEFGYFYDWRWAISNYAPPAVYFITSIGLLVGWLKGFPRWSYSYLGMTLYFAWYYSNGRFYGVVYGWRAWIPVLVVALVAILLVRSLRPLQRLTQGVWNDWTRLSFALYAFIVPMFTVAFLDDAWGRRELAGLVFDTLLLATGACLFLRSRSTLTRSLALQAAMVFILIRNVLLGGWFTPLRDPMNLPVLFILLWCGLMYVPAVVGLMRRGVSYLSTR